MCYNVSMDLLEIYLQSQTHKVLSQDIKSDMLSHCYMISSKDEFYLHELSIFAAKDIFCLDDNSPCEKCNNCNKINHSNMVDLLYFPKDDKKLMVEDINEIVSDCYIRPMSAKYKVYVLENFDECTVQAQNKILKTLEEPPVNVIFILTCKNELQVLPTIASRSKKITESPIDTQLINRYLEDKKVKNSSLISSMAEGNLTIANKLSENSNAGEIVDIVFDVLKNLRSSADILKYSSKIMTLKKDFIFFLETIVSVLRDIAVFGKSDNIIFVDRKNDYEYLCKTYSKEMILKIIEKVCLIHNKLDFNCNLTGVIDQMLLDILEVKFLWQK